MPDQPWFVHYPEGVAHELSISPETLLAMFSRSAQRFSRRPALYFFGKTLSYQECHALVERFACGLAALGIRKGDRVALCLPNSPQAVIAYFGILRAGGIVVPCNPTYTEYELSHQLRDAGARVIVVLDMMYRKIQHLDLETIIVTRRRGMAIWREKLFVLMARNAVRATAFFRLPPERVVELGVQVEM